MKLSLDSGPKLAKLAGDQVFLGDLAVRENSVCCLIVFVIFIELGRAYRLGGVEGGILKLSYGRGSKPKMDGNNLMGEVDPSRHHAKILIWQLWEG